MPEPAAVYWLVEQAIVWALTRDLAFVEQVGGRADPGSPAVAIRQVALRRGGRDINAELWKVSGWTVPSGDTITTFDVKKEEDQTHVLSNFEDIADDRPPRFPIADYLTALAREGRLASLGRRPGEAEWRALSPVEWNDLELFVPKTGGEWE
jgi:hypothetical protein